MRIAGNRMRLLSKIGVCAAVITFGVAAVSESSASSDAASVTTKRVQLRSGHIGRYLWSASLEAPESAEDRGAGDICLEISMLEPISPRSAEGSSVAGCGSPPSDRPTIEYLSGGPRHRARTVLAVLFPAEVRTATVELRGHRDRTIRAGTLRQDRLQGIADSPVSFVAHGYLGRVCILRIEGIAASGEVVSTLGRQACI